MYNEKPLVRTAGPYNEGEEAIYIVGRIQVLLAITILTQTRVCLLGVFSLWLRWKFDVCQLVCGG